MRSIYTGKCVEGATWHLVQYFDGRRIREISVKTYEGVICWTEYELPGIIENGVNFRTAKKRLAAYENRCSRRIG